ncbi:hypothetical protein AQUCO_02500266v1 [Aquilegia coerulea]|uniref:Secoisolariciresinol dehydrogenase n=1 Tax=Aquilegia coerulea TaxID=218851 RepID=A0A2G5DA86_AQUCA|nr:hypothetical protein AQUCO_02500266v1 [Aquilegia coerulea]
MEEKNTNKRWSLQGMTALVTGGSKGIGHAIVEELASLGASVYTCARSETQLNQVIEEWKELGFRVTGSVCDISVRQQREKLMEDVSSIFNGKLNIFVSNVGTSILKPTTEYTAEDFSFLMNTNFESCYHLCQLAHPLLKASGNGNIVFISSVAGLSGFFSGTIYAASKGALIQLTRTLACEWAKDNIRINTIAPGLIRTPMVEEGIKATEMLDGFLSRTPLRRLGEPSDVSSMVAYFCLPAASYITGQVICVDGGILVNGFYPTEVPTNVKFQQ